MGLDMYLSAKRYFWNDDQSTKKLRSVLELPSTKHDLSGSIKVSLTIVYWRKANQIHDWFVRNVQDGVDDCKSYAVGRDQLLELRDACNHVLDAWRKGDEETALKILPPQGGFFFGDTQINEEYFEVLNWTANAIDDIFKDKILFPSNNPKDGPHWDFEYQSSW